VHHVDANPPRSVTELISEGDEVGRRPFVSSLRFVLSFPGFASRNEARKRSPAEFECRPFGPVHYLVSGAIAAPMTAMIVSTADTLVRARGEALRRPLRRRRSGARRHGSVSGRAEALRRPPCSGIGGHGSHRAPPKATSSKLEWSYLRGTEAARDVGKAQHKRPPARDGPTPCPSLRRSLGHVVGVTGQPDHCSLPQRIAPRQRTRARSLWTGCPKAAVTIATWRRGSFRYGVSNLDQKTAALGGRQLAM